MKTVSYHSTTDINDFKAQFSGNITDSMTCALNTLGIWATSPPLAMNSDVISSIIRNSTCL